MNAVTKIVPVLPAKAAHDAHLQRIAALNEEARPVREAIAKHEAKFREVHSVTEQIAALKQKRVAAGVDVAMGRPPSHDVAQIDISIRDATAKAEELAPQMDVA